MADVGEDMEAVLSGLGVRDASAADAAGKDAQFALMRRCQGRDPSAFEELVKRFQPRVASVIRGILRNSNDCDDIAQQVFAKVYFGLDRFNYQSAVATWIYKIAVNECYDYLRKQKVRKATILADLSEEESARVENLDVLAHAGIAGPERQLEMRELANKLLARLDSEDRVLLVLKEIEGYSVREVAQILSLNENTVKVRLFRARQALLAAVERKRI
ncbi:MAG TPA: sigma-70 family RNA polymerase sigma factor [Terriglobales bacterium]|nr:sigma-70 family RNA polymerase sigma factor [Terriglobales bacterium]